MKKVTLESRETRCEESTYLASVNEGGLVTAIYGEVTGWQNLQDMDKHAHRRYRRSRVKNGTHLYWKTGRMVVPADERVSQEKMQV